MPVHLLVSCLIYWENRNYHFLKMDLGLNALITRITVKTEITCFLKRHSKKSLDYQVYPENRNYHFLKMGLGINARITRITVKTEITCF